ncbi:hypothetical protein Q2K19_12360 [Micromonospora soli]|uniref:hypothetical protein n=1 Tax=Micromonospora sp. NBRC 110009 TaxID=3061627 RepID=UPI002673FAFA|nr:hypothetical protein [Micromonospora sp. NBRC 110009]WKU01195.1 hypothetical protein Q2K19_12360 [Micromonospora sp. NBRC 110009]
MRGTSGRPSLVPGVLVVLLLAAVVGAVGWFEWRVREFRAANRAGQARAEAELAQRVRAYADAVIDAGEPTPSDDWLLAIAQASGVQMWEIGRTPDLWTVVNGSVGYGPAVMPGATVSACHRVTFRLLGTPAADARVERLPACSAVTALPTPAPTGS